jgi:RNA polymerase sigma-70 factor (ECF subfamily)
MDIEQLIKEYLKSIYNFVYRIVGNKNEAEDITQEVFIKVWKNITPPTSHLASLELRGASQPSLKPWIFKIARNTTIDFLRKRKNITFSQIDSQINAGDSQKYFEGNIEDTEDLPDEIFIKKELGKELENALSKIRIDFKEIILLRYMEEMTFEEIAEIVDKPLNTVKSHHHRALASLRKIILK